MSSVDARCEPPRTEMVLALLSALEAERCEALRRAALLHRLKCLKVAHGRELLRFESVAAPLRRGLTDDDYDEWYTLAQICEDARRAALQPVSVVTFLAGYAQVPPNVDDLQAAVAHYERMIDELVALTERLRGLARHLVERDRSPAGADLARSIEDSVAAQVQLVDHVRRLAAFIAETIEAARPALPCIRTPRAGAPVRRACRQRILRNAPPLRHGSAQLAAS